MCRRGIEDDSFQKRTLGIQRKQDRFVWLHGGKQDEIKNDIMPLVTNKMARCRSCGIRYVAPVPYFIELFAVVE